MTVLRGLMVIGLALLAVGCTEERAYIRAAASLSAPMHPRMLTVTFHDGARTWEARGSEFSMERGLGMPQSAEYCTRTSGTVDVSFAITDSTAAVVVRGEVTLPLRPDWRWRVDFINATDNPEHMCFGCAGSLGFALPEAFRAQDRDSLWVVWGGNWISDPVIY
jgi:hypothetical protein